MEDEKMKICPGCGKELPAELHFCLYCMTRLDDAKTEEVSEKSKRTAHKKYLIGFVAGLCAAIVAVAAVWGSFEVQRQSQTTKKEAVKDQTEQGDILRNVPVTYQAVYDANGAYPFQLINIFANQQFMEVKILAGSGKPYPQTESVVTGPVANIGEGNEDTSDEETQQDTDMEQSTSVGDVVASTDTGATDPTAASQPVNPEPQSVDTLQNQNSQAATVETELLQIDWNTFVETVKVELQQKYQNIIVLDSVSEYQSDSYAKVGQSCSQILGKDRFCQVNTVESELDDASVRDTKADWIAYYDSQTISTFSPLIDTAIASVGTGNTLAITVVLDRYENSADGGRNVYIALYY